MKPVHTFACQGSCRNQSGEHPGKIEAAVEAILILTKIPVSVFLKAKGMVGSIYGGLQVAKDGIDPGETFHVSTFTSLANNFSLLKTTSLRDGLETP